MSKAKVTFALTIGFFFSLLFHGNVHLRHLWPRDRKAAALASYFSFVLLI